MHGFRWHVWGMVDSRVFSFQKDFPHFRVQPLLTLLSQPPFIALGSLQCTIECLKRQVQMGTCNKNLNLNVRVLDLVNPPNNNHHVQDHIGMGRLVPGSAQSPTLA